MLIERRLRCAATRNLYSLDTRQLRIGATRLHPKSQVTFCHDLLTSTKRNIITF
jgi:hypothetical protein